jgi:hypothetical protein
MKAINKKRLERLEKLGFFDGSPVVIIYDPALPFPKEFDNDDGKVRIFIPDNKRQSQFEEADHQGLIAP